MRRYNTRCLVGRNWPLISRGSHSQHRYSDHLLLWSLGVLCTPSSSSASLIIAVSFHGCRRSTYARLAADDLGRQQRGRHGGQRCRSILLRVRVRSSSAWRVSRPRRLLRRRRRRTKQGEHLLTMSLCVLLFLIPVRVRHSRKCRDQQNP